MDVREIPELEHAEAMEIAAREYERMDDLLSSLDEADWTKPTDCERWDVKGIVSHIIGISEALLSVRETIRQTRKARPLAKELGLPVFHAQNELQVIERRDHSVDQLRAAYDALVPRMMRRRERFPIPRFVRLYNVALGLFSVAYLLDKILTRDIWMHRVDISRATDRPILLTPDHDGRFVADVVADWAGRHDAAFALHLEGPAGGSWSRGIGGEELYLDAVEFCRIMSGRAEGAGLLATSVPF